MLIERDPITCQEIIFLSFFPPFLAAEGFNDRRTVMDVISEPVTRSRKWMLATP